VTYIGMKHNSVFYNNTPTPQSLTETINTLEIKTEQLHLVVAWVCVWICVCV